jgi:hypothetical protein
MGTLLQILEIIFEVKRKRNNEKVFFFPLWTPPTFKLHNFIIFYSIKKNLNVIGMPLEVLQIIFEF